MMTNDSYDPRSYQDDLDMKDDDVDPIMDEGTDDPTRDFGIPPDDMRDELEKLEEEEDAGFDAEEEDRDY
jgi:hypothetical protein